MKLALTFETTTGTYPPIFIFRKVYEALEKVPGLEVEYINSHLKEPGVPAGPYSPMTLTIQNTENKKYIIASYWDKPHEFGYDIVGWDRLGGECVQIMISSGNYLYPIDDTGNIYQREITPIAYITHTIDTESIIPIPFEEKTGNELRFRGHLYNERLEMHEIDPEMVQWPTLSSGEYFAELNSNRINLSLNGVAEICHRDIEILSMGSVLMRTFLSQPLCEPLIPDVHYICIPEVEDSEEQVLLFRDTFNEIKNDTTYLSEIAKNGYEWYLRNGTIQGNADVILKQLDLERLK